MALGRLRQEDHEFEASLGYTVRPYHKKEMKVREKEKEKKAEKKGKEDKENREEDAYCHNSNRVVSGRT
jgi:hypothetical protein